MEWLSFPSRRSARRNCSVSRPRWVTRNQAQAEPARWQLNQSDHVDRHRMLVINTTSWDGGCNWKPSRKPVLSILCAKIRKLGASKDIVANMAGIAEQQFTVGVRVEP